MIYCLAVDMFVEAQKVDTTLSTRANELVKVYSNYFPSKEGTWSDTEPNVEGEKYRVGCWIDRETTIRFFK